MFPAVILSNSALVVSKETSNNNICSYSSGLGSSSSLFQDFGGLHPIMFHNSISSHHHTHKPKKKIRNLPGNPDPDAEVIALSPKTLLTTNRFVCEICNKGFQRNQNLQLHRRGHNLPWKLRQRNSGKDQNKKRAYVCPEPTCVHHHPSRALGDLTGIKKHYCRKHGEKKWKCEKCSKIYAVQSDWKAHSKTCGTREYRCDCGTLFSRKDSFITHRAFCDALAQESARLSAASNSILAPNTQTFHPNPQKPPPPPPFFAFSSHHHHFPNPWDPPSQNPNPNPHAQSRVKHEAAHIPFSSSALYEERTLMASPFGSLHTGLPSLSATALLQKAATVGVAGRVGSTMAHLDVHEWQTSDGYTRDFLGLAADRGGGGSSSAGGGSGSGGGGNMRELLSFTGGANVQFPTVDDSNHSLLKYQGFGFGATCSETWRKYC